MRCKLQYFLKIIFFVCAGFFIFSNSYAAFSTTTTVLASDAEKKEYQEKLNTLKKFVESGIAYIHKVGKEKAYKEFSNPKGKFVKGELYLFVYNYQGINLAHGGDPKHMIGRNLLNYRDIYGTRVFNLIVKVAKLGGGYVHYYWPEPGTNDIEYKTSYIAPIDNNTLIGSGYYENINVPIAMEIKVEELKAFVREAIEYYKTKGEKAAFAEFNNPQGKFHHGTMYIFVGSNEGVVLAHGGGDLTMIGKSYLDARDEFGTPYIQMFIEAVKTGGGVVTYYWPNPETNKTELKIAYVEPLTDNSFIGSGFYSQ